MKSLIIFSASSTFRPFSVVASLALDVRDEGSETIVLNISDYSYVTQGLPPRWYANLVGHDVFPNALENFLFENQILYSRAKQPQSGASAPLPQHVEEQFEQAIDSDLTTYLRTDTPKIESWFYRYTRRKISETSRGVYWEVRNRLQSAHFDLVLIPNGRVPEQRLAWLAALDEKVKVEFYEIGRATEASYYRGGTQVHDRTNSQAEVFQATADLSDTEVDKVAAQWLSTRSHTGLAIHPFGEKWEARKQSGTDQIQPKFLKAVFFSSSVDEFASYGESWNVHSWKDQYHAFGAVMRILQKNNVKCILRIHPNLLNKSGDNVKREIKQLRELKKQFPDLTIVPPGDKTNSYDLLEQADFVIVGRSTLGLEGSCMGKPVWTTTAARYDDVADIRKLHHPEDVNESGLTRWKVNSMKAKRFVAYWVIQDHPFRVAEKRWSTWDSMRAPKPLRLGTLLLKNAVPHKIHLLRLGLSRWRNEKRIFPH